MKVDIIEKSKKNISEDIKVTSSSDVVNLKDVRAIRNAIREHLLFIGLDSRNNVRNISLLGIGSTCNVIIDTKEIIRTALFSASDKVVLVHNHPSNDLKPSNDDIHLTNVTSEMLKVFNIKLQDHIIVTDKEHISMEKIQKIAKEENVPSIENIKKGFLIEENNKLKQQLSELEQKLNNDSRVKVVSAEYVGGYNDTTVYNVEIKLNGNKEYVTLERKYMDLKEPNYRWEVFSNLDLTDNEMQQIIDIVSNKLPIMSMDAPSTQYEDIFLETIEMEGV